MEGYIAEIRLFGGNFAPRNWAYCAGQLLAISQNEALFSLIGCTYGGDCQTTFALPDLRGRTAIGAGQGPGLPNYALGAKVGAETVTLTNTQLPSHTHSAGATSDPGDQQSPLGHIWAAEAVGATFVYKDATPDGSMRAGLIANTGGNQPHNNMQPSLGLNYIICLFGIYPSRS